MPRIGTLSIATFAMATLVSFAPVTRAAVRKHYDDALKSNVSLAQAVEAAERAGQGKTIGVEFDVENDHPIWEVKILGASGVNEYKVDASSGQVVKVEQEHIRGKVTSLAKGLKLDQLEGVAMPLPQAVSTAEQKLGGKAVKVQVEHEHHAIQYDVFVRKPGKTRHMKVAAAGAQPR